MAKKPSVDGVPKKKKTPAFTPVSDKQIASAYLSKLMNGIDAESIDKEALRELCGTNIRDSRCDRIAERIVERAQALVKPVDKYLAGCASK